MKLLAVDVGGTEIKSALIDEEIHMQPLETISSPRDNFLHFMDVVYHIYEPVQREVEGIAMSLPGFIDVEQGKVLGGGALTYLQGKEVGPLLAEKCRCPVSLENDAKAAAAAELWKGCLEGCRNAAAFILGTGVGGCLIVNGEIIRGKNNIAGEFSFVNVDESRNDFDGMMTSRCSTTALLNKYRAYSFDQGELNGRDFFERYHNGDVNAKKALCDVARSIAVQIQNLEVLINVEKVAIGGGISRQEVLIERIREYLNEMTANRYFMDSGNGDCIAKVEACHFSAEANLVGAVYSYLKRVGRQ